MSFVHYEELLQNYFENSEHFTVVPKIVFLDVDVHALNGFLMRDRPGALIPFKFAHEKAPKCFNSTLTYFSPSLTFSQQTT